MAISLATTLILVGSACSSQGNSNENSQKPALGVNGADLATILVQSDLGYDDQMMLANCRTLWGYQYSEIRSAVFNPDDIKVVAPSDRKQHLRNFLKELENKQKEYEEFSFYISGVREELYKPGSKNANFLAVTHLCDSYRKAQKAIEIDYLTPLTINGGCWSNKYANAELQEKIAGSWEYVDYLGELASIPLCTERGFGFGATFSVSRSTLDADPRNFRIVWKPNSGKFADGTSSH